MLKLKRSFFIVFGFLSLALGIIGLFLPLLPTTPFLLLTALCFNRGSERFHSWLIHHRWFGPPIADWQARRAIRTEYKVLATVMILGSCFLLLSKPSFPSIGKLMYLCFVCGLLAFIWTRKSE